MASRNVSMTALPPTARKKSSRLQGGWIVHLFLTLLPGAVAVTILVLVLLSNAGSANGKYFLTFNGAILLLLSSLALWACIIAIFAIEKLWMYIPASKALSWKMSSSMIERQLLPHFDRKLISALHGDPRAFHAAYTKAKHDGIGEGLLLFGLVALFLLALLVCVATGGGLWLHAATQISTIQPSSGTPYGLPGRKIDPTCLKKSDVPSSFQVQLNHSFCQPESRMDLVFNTSDAWQTAADVSQSNQVLTVPSKYGDLSVLAGFTSGTRVFVADSYGVGASCSLSTTPCTVDAAERSYNCPDKTFSRVLNQPIFLSYPKISGSSFNFEAAVLVIGSQGTFSNPEHKTGSTAVNVSKDGRGLLAVMGCTASAYKVSYFFNSGIIMARSVDHASSEIASLILNPMFPGQINGFDVFGTDLLFSATQATALVGKSLDDIVSTFANTFRRVAIASSTGVMQESGTSPAGSKTQNLTILPIAALWLVLAVCFFLSTLGLVLGIVAAVLSFKDPRVKEAKACLTHKGALVAMLSERNQDSPTRGPSTTDTSADGNGRGGELGQTKHEEFGKNSS